MQDLVKPDFALGRREGVKLQTQIRAFVITLIVRLFIKFRQRY
jgi:hypothetical protein